MNETPTAVLDQAAFQRVWQRVMPQDRPDCPFTLDPPGPAAVPAPQSPVPVPVQAQPPRSVPCLGEASAGELPGLRERMDQAARARQVYRALERRAGRRGMLSALAAEKDRQVRRLAAAYFLISGEGYTPAPEAVPLPRTNALALRERFRGEQLEAAALMDACQASADPCLGQLYRELAEENRGFADRIRQRLEQG